MIATEKMKSFDKAIGFRVDDHFVSVLDNGYFLRFTWSTPGSGSSDVAWTTEHNIIMFESSHHSFTLKSNENVFGSTKKRSKLQT